MNDNSTTEVLRQQLARTQEDVENYLRQANTALKYAEQVWWSWNLPRRLLTIRSIDECILGYLPSEMEKGEDFWWDRMHPEDIPEVNSSLEECFQGRSEIWRCEHRLRDAANEWVWVEQNGFVLRRNAQREVVEMVGTTRKTQERYQLLDLFQGSESVIEALVEKTPLLFWLRETEGNILLSSKAMDKHFGKLTNNPVDHQICPTVGIDAWKMDFEIAVKGQCVDSEIDLRRKSGEIDRYAHHLIPITQSVTPFAVLELFMLKTP